MLYRFLHYYTSHKIRLHRLISEGSWIIAGQIGSSLGMLALVRVLTKNLNPSQYGQIALGLTVVGLINQVIFAGITNGVGRYYSIAAEKQDLAAYWHAVRYLIFYATVAILIIGLLLLLSLLSLGYSDWIGLVTAALLFSVFSSYNSVLNCIQTAARQRAVVAIHGGLESWLKIVLAVALMLWFGASSTAVIIGYTLSSLLTVISQFFCLRRTIPSQRTDVSGSQKWVHQIWVYSLPFASWGALAGRSKAQHAGLWKCLRQQLTLACIRQYHNLGTPQYKQLHLS